MISSISEASTQKNISTLKEHEKSLKLIQSENEASQLVKNREDLIPERQSIFSDDSASQFLSANVKSENSDKSDKKSNILTPNNSVSESSANSSSAFNKIFKNLPAFNRCLARKRLFFSQPGMLNVFSAYTQLTQNNDSSSEKNKSVLDSDNNVLSKTKHVSEKYSNINSDSTCSKIIKKCFIPVSKAPTGDDIQKSLTTFGYPEVSTSKPFYSSISDVSTKKEVGSKVLKVASFSVSDLEDFNTNLSNIITLCKWRESNRDNLNTSQTYPRDDNANSESTKLSFCSERLCTITPAFLPPTPSQVQLWVKARKLLEDNKKEETSLNKKTYQTAKVLIPSSPGDDNDDSLSEISLTPHSVDSVHSSPVCTSRTNLKDIPTSHSTPHQIQLGNIVPAEHSPVEVSSKNKVTHDSDSSVTCVTSPEYSRTMVRKQMSPIPEEDPPSQHKIESPSNSQTSLDDPSLRKLLLKSQFRNQFTTPKGVKRRLSTGCQIEGVTLNNTHGFKMSFENLQDGRSLTQHQHLTILTMELHIETRGDLKPDPAVDPIQAFFYLVTNDVPEDSDVARSEYGIIVVNPSSLLCTKPYLHGTGVDVPVIYVEDEKGLLSEIEKLIRRTDPDFLIGYEVEMLSWGFLFRRAYTLGLNFCPLVSRIPSSKNESYITDENEETTKQDTEMNLAGRIMLNVWRLMRHEISLQSYTFENIMYHILHERVSLYSFRKLTQWWNHSSPFYRWIVVEHYLVRVKGIMAILDQLDLISRTSELARLFGIQFYEVLSRGSQFRVESMMLRMAKPSNFVALSPSIQQRAKMRAPECLQLIMEPESKFYTDPVIVLDFQSLYPSMIIAYNYCFSTCLGRVEHLGQSNRFEFGCSQLKIPLSELLELKDHVNISPCGVAFVNSKVRHGILPQMLEEILNTRLMVKKSMKEHKNNKLLQRVLHARQLGLKLIANVTYGYTAANFSGRMPCVEVADSVVSKGRETLERAINLVEKNSEWGAKVVYGDTDSLFVLVEGRSKEQAFKIGNEIAEAVTNVNPKPVKLKLEKVYQPCILQTKKRYVGYMYESPEQTQPVYDAKGIETVRRDGCPAVAKILEKSLRILFESADVSQVKSYVCHQFDKILQGNLNIQDLIFAREYRGMSGYKPGACVPALELTKRWLESDKRAEPRVSERVPYVIINGPPGVPLIRSVRSPTELIADPSLRINSLYYITKVIIPPLDRCFSLLGVDVDAWFADMPRKYLSSLPSVAVLAPKKSTISQYFSTMNCVSCEELTNSGLCASCQEQSEKTAFILSHKISTWERTYDNITKVCQSCCRHFEPNACVSIDCPTYFRRNLAMRDLTQAPFLQELYYEHLTF